MSQIFTSFEEFKQDLLTSLRIVIPSGYRMEEMEIDSEHRLSFLKEGKKEQAAPSFRLDEMYDWYINQDDEEQAMRHLVSCIHDDLVTKGSIAEKLTDRNFILDHVVFRLLPKGTEENKEIFLTHWQDLPVTYVVHFVFMTDVVTLTVKREHAEYLHISEAELREHARKNAENVYSDTIMPLSQAIFGMPMPDVPTIEPDFQIYILGDARLCNASVIITTDALRTLGNELEKDLILIPSSIHEWLLIPRIPEMSTEELTEMIQSVNGSELTPEETLSDHPYFYNHLTGEISSSLEVEAWSA